MQPQFELNFDDVTDDSAMREREERRLIERRDLLAEIAKEWSLPIGERVEVWLKEPECRLLGRLELVEPPREIERRFPLHLHIGGKRFTSLDVEACNVE